MINNNPYNIPQKKPLSQSNIYSDTNTSRHSSTYMQNRGNNDIMYNSSIFMKNSSVMNRQCDQSYFQPIREPLSPHSKYPKPSSNIQFTPTYNNFPIRQPETNFFPISTPKDVNVQKGLNQLKEKIEKIEKRIQAQEKKQNLSSQLHNKTSNSISENESIRLIVQDNLKSSTVLKELVNSIVQQSIETQNKKIWQRMRDLDQSISFSSNHISSEKLSKLEDSFFKSQSDKIHDEQLMNRIKTIEKTIRQMGQDIHLVNDKEENLLNKIQSELPWIRNQIKTLKLVDKRVEEFEIKNDELGQEIQQVIRKVNSFQATTQINLSNKIKQVQAKAENLNNAQKKFKSSFDRCFSEPIILKYLQKFQISGNNTSKYSHTNSTKGESCQQILINQITYFIDPEGYLLDNDRFYLITGIQNQRVRLDPKHVQLMKERNILI